MPTLKSHPWGLWLLWAVLALPGVGMVASWLGGAAAEGMLHGSGEFSARFMIIAMIATPLRLLLPGWRGPIWLVRRRRAFGVAAFAYAVLHTLFYLDDAQLLTVVIAELTSPGIWTGWLAFLIFLPLGLTSNDRSQRLMRGAWKRLQRWVYPAAVLTLAHWILVHNNIGPALVHFIPLAALEIARIRIQRKSAREAYS